MRTTQRIKQEASVTGIRVASITTGNMRRRFSLHGQKWCSFKRSPHLTSILPKVPKLCGSMAADLDLTA